MWWRVEPDPVDRTATLFLRDRVADARPHNSIRPDLGQSTWVLPFDALLEARIVARPDPVRERKL